MKSRATESEFNHCINVLKEQLEEAKRKTELADCQVFAFINLLERGPVRDLMALYYWGSGATPNFNEARRELACTALDLKSMYMADKAGFVPSLAKGIKKHAAHSLMEAMMPRIHPPFTRSTIGLDSGK